MQRELGIVVICALAVFQTGCKTTTAADAWNNVLKKCTESPTWTPKNMVYMGPSNNVGVGAVWREKQEGGFGLIEFAPKGATAPDGQPIYSVGEQATCTGEWSKSVKVAAEANLVLSQVVANASGGLAAELNQAKTAQVKVDSWRELQIAEGPFERWVKSLAADNDYKRSLLRQDARVAYRTIEVTGLSATLTFEGTRAADIHAKYGGTVATSPTPELGGKLTIAVTEGNKLVITAPQMMFIEAELARYFPGVGTGRGGFKKVSAKQNASLALER